MQNINEITQKAIDAAKLALSKGVRDIPKGLEKTITEATGLVTYDLQAPAKNLYPVLTPLRNNLPRVSRPGERYGTATHWVAVDAINGSGYDSMGWVPEGQRSGRMSYTVTNHNANYVTLGEEDSITFEAESAAVGFEDVNATASLRTLQKTMLKEESGLLGGNATLTLATPGTITAGSGGSGSLSTTYYYNVVALTYEGLMNSNLTNGVATAKNITGADGDTYTLNGGSSAPSAQVSDVAAGALYLTATVPAVAGACGYAWFVGTTTGQAHLQAITTINSMKITAVSTTTQLIGAVVGDHSNNPVLAFDGILTQGFNASNSYIKTLDTGTAGVGSYLTPSGTGTVVEIDDMLKSMWTNYKVSPDKIYVSAQELGNVTKAVLQGSGGAPLLRVNAPATPQQAYTLAAGGVIATYFNPYTKQMIPIEIHPTLPSGTILGWCEQLPAWYQSNQVPNVAEVITRRDYYRLDWPLRTRKREFGVYMEEVLAVYAPFGIGIIRNIGDGVVDLSA